MRKKGEDVELHDDSGESSTTGLIVGRSLAMANASS
jgi:hypothetical protein